MTVHSDQRGCAEEVAQEKEPEPEPYRSCDSETVVLKFSHYHVTIPYKAMNPITISFTYILNIFNPHPVSCNAEC